MKVPFKPLVAAAFQFFLLGHAFPARATFWDEYSNNSIRNDTGGLLLLCADWPPHGGRVRIQLQGEEPVEMRLMPGGKCPCPDPIEAERNRWQFPIFPGKSVEVWLEKHRFPGMTVHFWIEDPVGATRIRLDLINSLGDIGENCIRFLPLARSEVPGELNAVLVEGGAVVEENPVPAPPAGAPEETHPDPVASAKAQEPEPPLPAPGAKAQDPAEGAHPSAMRSRVGRPDPTANRLRTLVDLFSKVEEEPAAPPPPPHSRTGAALPGRSIPSGVGMLRAAWARGQAKKAALGQAGAGKQQVMQTQPSGLGWSGSTPAGAKPPLHRVPVRRKSLSALALAPTPPSGPVMMEAPPPHVLRKSRVVFTPAPWPPGCPPSQGPLPGEGKGFWWRSGPSLHDGGSLDLKSAPGPQPPRGRAGEPPGSPRHYSITPSG